MFDAGIHGTLQDLSITVDNAYTQILAHIITVFYLGNEEAVQLHSGVPAISSDEGFLAFRQLTTE